MTSSEKIIVSLTSYPARIGFVARALEAVYAQNLQPDKIILWLSRDQFPGELADMPGELSSLHSEGRLDIQFRDGDLKSHKKYFYALQEYPEDCIITLDDDILYDKELVTDLVAGHRAHPGALCTVRAHLMVTDPRGALLPYNRWPHESDMYMNIPCMKAFATTGAGTLFPPHVFGPELLDEAAIMSTCLHGDDLWIKANCLLKNIPTLLVRHQTGLSYVEGSQEESLYSGNFAGGNDRQMSDIISYIKEKYNCDIIKDVLAPEPIYTEEICDYINALINDRRRLRKREEDLHQANAKVSDAERRFKGSQSKLESCQTQLADTRRKLEESKSKLTDTQGKLTETRNQLTECKRQLASTSSQLTSASDRLARTRSELDAVYASKADKVGTALAAPIRKLRGDK